MLIPRARNPMLFCPSNPDHMAKKPPVVPRTHGGDAEHTECSAPTVTTLSIAYTNPHRLDAGPVSVLFLTDLTSPSPHI
jgi:hypothetical protein